MRDCRVILQEGRTEVRLAKFGGGHLARYMDASRPIVSAFTAVLDTLFIKIVLLALENLETYAGEENQGKAALFQWAIGVL